MDTKTLLVKRRAKRGRPRKDEPKKDIKAVPVYVARDPQGIKLFVTEPSLSVFGTWEGTMVTGVKPMNPRAFVLQFRNAVLPEKGKTIKLDMGVVIS